MNLPQIILLTLISGISNIFQDCSSHATTTLTNLYIPLQQSLDPDVIEGKHFGHLIG